MIPYAGIGSRKTPQEVCEICTELASKLSNTHILRSGGASGADLAFELGASQTEIYLPWRRFNGNSSNLYLNYPISHPSISKNVPRAVKLLFSRNIQQVLGHDFSTPSKFLICWTEEGKVLGGTGFTIGIARQNSIPVFNLGSKQLKDLTSDQVLDSIFTTVK